MNQIENHKSRIKNQESKCTLPPNSYLLPPDLLRSCHARQPDQLMVALVGDPEVPIDHPGRTARGTTARRGPVDRRTREATDHIRTRAGAGERQREVQFFASVDPRQPPDRD